MGANGCRGSDLSLEFISIIADSVFGLSHVIGILLGDCTHTWKAASNSIAGDLQENCGVCALKISVLQVQ